MSSYQPPISNPAIFDTENFTIKTEGLTQQEMDKRYLRYPVAQGSETFPNDIIVNGATTLNGNTTVSKRVLQTLNTGAGDWSSVNGYYALDKRKAPMPTEQSGILSTNTWHLRPSPVTDSYQFIYWSDEFDLFIAPCVNTNRVATSPDGNTFTSILLTWSNDEWNGAVSGRVGSTNVLVLVSSSTLFGSAQVAYSTDGSTFTPYSSSEISDWTAVCFSTELQLFVAVAEGGTNRIMTSSNGTAWTSRATSFSGNWQSVCWSPELSLFVAVASGGTARAMYSSDGINWFESTPAANNQWHSVCWSSELGIFCAVSDTGSGTQHVMTSSNGVNWTIQNAAESNQFRSVVWAADIGLFCATAISGTNRIMTSIDGVTWIAYSAPAVEQWHSVAWSPFLGFFCGVNDTSASNKFMISNLKGQNPTNDNIFNSPYNNIDSSGNWTIKAKNLTNTSNMTINSSFGTTTVQSNSASSIILNNHSIVNSNFQFPASFTSPSSGQLGYNAVSSTQTHANITTATDYNFAAFSNVSPGVYYVVIYSKYRKSAQDSPSALNLIQTKIGISTTTSYQSYNYEEYWYGQTQSVGWTFPAGTTHIQAVSMSRFLTLTATSSIYILNYTTFTKNANDQLENKVFAVITRVA